MDYTTQMDAARKGIVTPQMKVVAEKEKMAIEKLMALVASGKVAIPANKMHESLSAEAVGQDCRTKINVNLGVSPEHNNHEEELQKVQNAIDMKAEAIMDLSNFGKTRDFRRKLVKMSTAMIGTVPMYDAVGMLDKDLKDISVDEFFSVVEQHAEDGVDFMTIHCGMNRKTAQRIKDNPRLTNIVSRGGSLLFAWMEMNDQENPFYEYYDRLLDICEKYDVTLSLGDACRPGCTHDATDAAQIEELITLGELTKRAWDHNVQVMIEGPGHMVLNEIAANMKLEKDSATGLRSTSSGLWLPISLRAMTILPVPSAVPLRHRAVPTSCATLRRQNTCACRPSKTLRKVSSLPALQLTPPTSSKVFPAPRNGTTL